MVVGVVLGFPPWLAAALLYGDGSQERDFTFVEDIARGALAALQRIGFQVINLGSNRPVALMEVINVLQGMLGRETEICQEPMPETDVMSTWADVSQAWDLLRWEPTTTLEAGLRATVDWYVQQAEWVKEVKTT